MNILYALLVCVCCIGCYGQNKGLNNQQRNQNLQSITRPLNVSKEAQLIDLGFDASPVYFWVKYEGKKAKDILILLCLNFLMRKVHRLIFVIMNGIIPEA